jgi:hypothetical protein
MMHQAREGGSKRGERKMRRRWRAESDTARKASTNIGVSSADAAAVCGQEVQGERPAKSLLRRACTSRSYFDFCMFFM